MPDGAERGFYLISRPILGRLCTRGSTSTLVGLA